MIKPRKILVISSDTAQLKQIEEFVSDIFNEEQLSRTHFNKVLLCINEAVINAIEHGNNHDSKKTVSIGIQCKKNCLDVLIKDQGAGFDLNKIPDPTCKENITKESGRGIHIIKSLANGISFNSKGNFMRINITYE